MILKRQNEMTKITSEHLKSIPNMCKIWDEESYQYDQNCGEMC